jgi:hypothetical protein
MIKPELKCPKCGSHLGARFFYRAKGNILRRDVHGEDRFPNRCRNCGHRLADAFIQTQCGRLMVKRRRHWNQIKEGRQAREMGRKGAAARWNLSDSAESEVAIHGSGLGAFGARRRGSCGRFRSQLVPAA